LEKKTVHDISKFFGFYDREETWETNPEFRSWDKYDYISVTDLERLYVKDDKFVIGFNCRDVRVGSNRPPLPTSLILYENSINGDFQIKCRNDVLVRAES
jgi:hypothetical protein